MQTFFRMLSMSRQEHYALTDMNMISWEWLDHTQFTGSVYPSNVLDEYASLVGISMLYYV